MNKFLVYFLSVVAMFSVANSRPENCGAGALGLTYCGMNWEDYFDGSVDYGEVRRNRGGGTRGGSNDGGSYNGMIGGRGGQYGAQDGNNFEGSRNGFTARSQGYGLSGSGYDQGSNGGYSSSFQNTNQAGTISNHGTTDQGFGYAQGSNGGYSSSFTTSIKGNAFGQGDSWSSSNNYPTEGQENSYFENNGDNIGGYAATVQSEEERNAAVGQGSAYLQSSNSDYSSSFTTSGQVSAFDGGSYSSSGQGSGYAGGSNAGNRAGEGSSSRCSTCGVSTINNIGNGKFNKNEINFLPQSYK